MNVSPIYKFVYFVCARTQSFVIIRVQVNFMKFISKLLTNIKFIVSIENRFCYFVSEHSILSKYDNLISNLQNRDPTTTN